MHMIDSKKVLDSYVAAVFSENQKLKRQLAAADVVERENNELIDALMAHIESLEQELNTLRHAAAEVGDNRVIEQGQAFKGESCKRPRPEDYIRGAKYLQDDCRLHA